jgi:D-3-phosphoglycerate dehydrogenase
MLGEVELGKMKASAILVNTARGPIVQHDALVRVLRDGRIAGAGIDVQENEPLPSSSPLRTMACVLLTPHVAWYSEDSQKELLSSVGEESARILKGEEPLSIVNVERPRSRLTARENRECRFERNRDENA